MVNLQVELKEEEKKKVFYFVSLEIPRNVPPPFFALKKNEQQVRATVTNDVTDMSRSITPHTFSSLLSDELRK